MKCVMCKGGDLAPGKTTLTVQRGETILIIKDVLWWLHAEDRENEVQRSSLSDKFWRSSAKSHPVRCSILSR